MKICGIVVEYNPMTNGHLYHIQKAREITQCDLLIAVMSGNFTQRGEPAIVDKWQRAKAAVQNGVDLVIELPFLFACQSADYFAKGAIAILNAMHCDSIVFGSETLTKAKIDELLKNSQSKTYQEKVQALLNEGYSYPQATSLAFENLQISLPNDILGFCYAKQIQLQNTKIDYFPIHRQTSYHDLNIQSMSASSIRKAAKEKKDIAFYSPMSLEGKLHDKEDLFEPLYQKLMLSNIKDYKEITILKEGIEHRFLEKIQISTSMDDFLHQVTTKRYTTPRVLRSIVHLLLDNKEEPTMPAYLRLLAASKVGQQHLRYFRDNTSLPFITRFSQIKHPHLDLELKVAKLYALSLPIDKRQMEIKKEYASIPYFE